MLQLDPPSLDKLAFALSKAVKQTGLFLKGKCQRLR